MSKSPAFSYEAAPPGSPDKFRLTADAHSKWTGCPRWIYDLVARKCVRLDTGYVVAYMEKGKLTLHACVFKGFYFAVSVAPNFERARGPACFHDWLYANAEALAAAWSCAPRDVTHLADHWFLALMTFTGFGLRRTYFCAVRMLGYGFHQLLAKAVK